MVNGQEQEVHETKDGTGSGDCDRAYDFGNPRAYLKLIDQARLLVMRGYIKDAQAGEKGGAGDGDLAPPADSAVESTHPNTE